MPLPGSGIASSIILVGVGLLRTVQLLNEADESRSIALAAYQEGATQLLPLLDAQRTRTEVRQQYFRTLFDYQTDLIDLELAVGKELQ